MNKTYTVQWENMLGINQDILTIDRNGTFSWEKQQVYSKEPKLWRWTYLDGKIYFVNELGFRSEMVYGEGHEYDNNNYDHMIPCFEDFVKEIERIDLILTNNDSDTK